MHKFTHLPQLVIAILLLGVMPLALAGNLCGANKTDGTSGIGGTGNSSSSATCSSNKPEGGIGGTGDLAVSDGIGGTGITSIGIIGTITEFGSIWVNGIRVQYHSGTPVQMRGASITADQLALGQVVAVEATGSETAMQAQHINVQYAVIGPIAKIDRTHNLITVLNQTIRVSLETYTAGIENLKIGDPVQISGLRATGDIIIASRIDPAAHGIAEVMGRVDQLTDDGFNIPSLSNMPGLSVNAFPQDGLVVGSEVRVTGRWDGKKLHAQQIKREPALPFEGKHEHLSLQGYVSASDASGRIRLGTVEIEVPKNIIARDGVRIEFTELAEKRIQVRARIDANRRVIAERIKLDRPDTKHERSDIDKKSGKATKKNEDRDERGDRVRRLERPERADRHERIEQPEHIEQPERIEQPEKD